MSLEIIREADRHFGAADVFRRFDALFGRLSLQMTEGFEGLEGTYELTPKQLWPLQRRYAPDHPDRPDAVVLHEELPFMHHNTDKYPGMDLYDYLAELSITTGTTTKIYAARTTYRQYDNVIYPRKGPFVKRRQVIYANTFVRKDVVSTANAVLMRKSPQEIMSRWFDGLDETQTKARIAQLTTHEVDPLEASINMSDVSKPEEASLARFIKNISSVIHIRK